MSTEELEQFVIIRATLNSLAADVQKVARAVENLALQTTNNQVENRKALDAIKTGILDTNLAVKFPPHTA